MQKSLVQKLARHQNGLYHLAGGFRRKHRGALFLKNFLALQRRRVRSLQTSRNEGGEKTVGHVGCVFTAPRCKKNHFQTGEPVSEMGALPSRDTRGREEEKREQWRAASYRRNRFRPQEKRRLLSQHNRVKWTPNLVSCIYTEVATPFRGGKFIREYIQEKIRRNKHFH